MDWERVAHHHRLTEEFPVAVAVTHGQGVDGVTAQTVAASALAAVRATAEAEGLSVTSAVARVQIGRRRYGVRLLRTGRLVRADVVRLEDVYGGK